MSVHGVGLAAGLAFGFVLVWAGVADDVTIENMLRFKEAHLYLMLGSTVVTAGVLMRVLKAAKARSPVSGKPIAWTTARPERRHVVGSLLFGLGWAFAGTCPGPIAAQVGQGRLMALFTMAGLFAGVGLRDLLARRPSESAPVAELPSPGL